MDESDLHEYQVRAVEFLKRKKRAALFLQMGLGKTIIALTLIEHLMQAGRIRNALVIAPKKLLKSTWIPEIRKWDHLFLLHMTIIEGPKLEGRKAQLKQGLAFGLYGVSVDSIHRYEELGSIGWHLVIVDESIKVKNRNTRRFTGARRLTGNPKGGVVIMSGIPAPNSEMDLWSQMYLVDRGKRLGKQITAFRNRWFSIDYAGLYTPNEGASEQIAEKVRDISLSLSAKDYLDMPDRIVVNHQIELSKDIMEGYGKLEKGLILELQKELLEVFSAGAELQKTMQFCNGFVYGEDIHRVHDEKLDALEEIVEGNAGENFLVSYWYKEDLRALKERFPYGVEVTEENIELWNEGKVRMMFLQPQSSGYGLNLQKGGSIVVWFSLVWSYSDYEQTNARVYRQGQTRPVRIIRLVCKDTVEERISHVLERKRKSNETIMESLKAEMVK